MIRLLPIAPLFVACTAGMDDAGTPLDDTPLVLEEREYPGTIDRVDAGTCGDLTDALTWTIPAPFVLAWDSANAFSLDNGIVQTCTVDDAGAVACTRPGGEVSWDDHTRLVYDVEIHDFDSLSTRSFTETERWKFDCDGSGCATFAQEYDVTFPCALDVDITWGE